jgi:hypothetical protein
MDHRSAAGGATNHRKLLLQEGSGKLIRILAAAERDRRLVPAINP